MPKISALKAETLFRNAKPQDKDYKIVDSGGLHMLVRKSGSKVWRIRYTLKGSKKENIYTIGAYPLIGLTEARKKKDEVKKLLLNGIDPNKKKEEDFKIAQINENTFETVARDWLENYVPWVIKHKKNITANFEKDIFPAIGSKSLLDIKPTDIVAILKTVADKSKRNAPTTAIRMGGHISAVFEHAINHGLCDYNPAQKRARTIKAPQVKNRPHLKIDQLPEFFVRWKNHRDCKEYIKLGLILQLLTMVRPGELRGAEWSEFDFEKAEWFIPASRMKMKRDHLIPLSHQAVLVIARLKEITGNNKYVFPGTRATDRPISDATMIKVVRLMGYSNEELVPHGFRATASTILNQKGFNRDHIERQLAHVEGNKIRAAYNHAEYLPQRKEMLQWWADFLDKAKAGDISL